MYNLIHFYWFIGGIFYPIIQLNIRMTKRFQQTSDEYVFDRISSAYENDFNIIRSDENEEN